MTFSFRNGILLIITVMAYVIIGYAIDRNETAYLLSCFGAAFFAYFYWAKRIYADPEGLDEKGINQWLWIGLILRCIFLFSIPVLSDDYFRFIWDGSMLVAGENPYLILPDSFINHADSRSIPNVQLLYEAMNSPMYYTIYPPVAQAVFGLGVFLFPGNILGQIVVMRLVLVLSEIGTVLCLRKILPAIKQRSDILLLYVLNPLVIVELTGNLHFEALMICFFVMAVYALIKDDWKSSAFFWGLSISTKLIPLIFLPIILVKLTWKKSLSFYALVLATIVFLSIPFIGEDLIRNFYSSVNLYFQSFEFNASVYYLVRSVGFALTGYNIIQTAGPILSVITFLILMVMMLKKKKPSWTNLFQTLLFVLTIYYAMATTVHPWYISTLVLLSALNGRYWYALVWSALVVISYTAYSGAQYQEHAVALWIEYGLLMCWFFMELLGILPMKKWGIKGND